MKPRSLLAILAGLLPWARIASAQEVTHGYLVGSVRPDSAIVWLRTDRPCEVVLRYGTNADPSDMRQQVMAKTESEHDCAAKLALSELLPGTRYYYAATLRDGEGAPVTAPGGTFRTAPPEDNAAAATFAFSADVLLPGEFEVWNDVGSLRPDLYLSLGDVPYADGARDLSDYRQAHLRTRDHLAFQRFFAAVPIAAVWDDHEVSDNWDATTDPRLVELGKRAWREAMPVPDRDREIYRSFRWGRGIEVFLLDCRSHRGANAAPDLPGKSMLGSVQKRWLIDALARSQATFKLVCSSVPLRYGTTGKDSWHGFMRERQELFAAILGAGVDNVVFLTADRHWAAVHHLSEGFAEYQVGPLAAATRALPGHPDSQVRFLRRTRSWGLVRLEPDADPPRLTVELYGPEGQLWRESLLAEPTATVTWSGSGGSMLGPRYFAAGEDSVLPAVAPGDYQVHFPAVAGHKPSSLPVSVPPGGDVHVAAGPKAEPGVLWSNSFSSGLHGMTVVDEGEPDEPSAWFVDNGALYQSSDVESTFAWFGDRRWRDYELSVRARPEDDDAFGVLFRYRDPDNYYRFSMDAERRQQRLIAVVDGQVRVLKEERQAHWLNRWYRLTVRVQGDRITVLLDGRQVLAAVDGMHAEGAAGLHTGRNSVTAFDDVAVRSWPAPDRPAPLLIGDFALPGLEGWELSTPVEGEATWYAETGELRHGGRGEGNGASAVSALASGDEQWRDYFCSVRLRHDGGGPIGVAFRYQGPLDHYRILWDPQSDLVRLERLVGGDRWLLHEEQRVLVRGQWHRFACQADGFRMQAWIDDRPFARVLDGAHEHGRVAVLAADSADARFDQLEVWPPVAEQAAAVSTRSRQGDWGRCSVTAVHPGAVGQEFWLALFDGRPRPLRIRQGGFGPFVLTEGDAEHFLAGCQLPGMGPFRGEIGADGYSTWLRWPITPPLFGSVLEVGGWAVTPSGDEVLAELPRVRVVL